MESDYLRNKYKVNLKEHSKTDVATEALLKAIGLYPLPDDISIHISDDSKYLNIQYKKSKFENPLLFQIPLEKRDLSALHNRSDSQELHDRYYTYINEYMSEIKKYALDERKYLQEKYPDLVFNIKIRIKSYDSYINKLNQNILENKSPYINDIMAERIIISEYNGSQDEEELKKMCYKVAKSLYDFRGNTDFRMQKKDEEEQFQAESDKPYITKDYIAKPKDNGYQSLHLLMENMYNKDFTYETQIRTLGMENQTKTSGKISHLKYKPRPLNELSVNRVPIYADITPFNDAKGNPIILDPDFKDRFYNFYTLNYDDYKNELNAISKSLGLSLKEIRKRLETVDFSKYITIIRNAQITNNKENSKENSDETFQSKKERT